MKPKFFFRQKPSTLPYKTKNFKRKKKVKILNNKRLRAGVTKREMRYGMEGKPVIRKIVFFFFFFNFCSTVVKFACNKTNGKQTVVEKEKRFKTVTGRCWQKYLLFFVVNNYVYLHMS